MRKREDDDLTSFELLLDTMCNAFGGIVFIALLLVILSRAIELNSHEDAELPVSSSSSSSIDMGTGFLMRTDLQNLNQNQDQEQIRLKKALESEEKLIYLAGEKIRSLEKNIESLNREIDVLQNKNKRTIRFPRIHTIEKKPVYIAIKYGKLYPINDLSAPFSGREGRGYDLSHVRLWEQGNLTTIEPISGKGQSIEPGAEKSGKLRAALENIDPDREFISFVVFPDSFGEFHQVKSMFLARGFDYNWLIIRDQLSIVKGKGGGEHHAQ